MPPFSRREFLRLMAHSSTLAVGGQLLAGHANAATPVNWPDYDLPMTGAVRILHTTDWHGQLLPVYFREPNANLGIGDAYGRLPHIVGKSLLATLGVSDNSPEAYAFTYLNFSKNARQYGRMGGFAHMKTLLDRLRAQAGGRQNTLTLDGGDLWQGSGTSLWTRGVDMVEASNILGIDIMVGHWEFTYREPEVLANVALFQGDFIGQNVRVKEDALFDDRYAALVERYDGRGLYAEDTGHAFQPYVLREVNGAKIAVIGQAFPRTANANPPEFFPDWSFGLREDDLAALVADIKDQHTPDAIVLLSHNGMDVDIKMAERVAGLDAIFGGHTHDGIPLPLKINNPGGRQCWVTNAGSNGKFLGVMDLDIADRGGLNGLHYTLLPVFSDALPADAEMTAFLKQLRNTRYTTDVQESRAADRRFNPARLGKTYAQILEEKLAIADRTLYRRGNFMGTWDQILCNALRAEYDADIAMSPGVRWGTTTPQGHWITMEDVMSQCAMTYAETYANTMTGAALLSILERIANNLFDPDPYLQSGGDMARVGGMDYTINPEKPLGQRITDARLDNGEPLQPDTTYRVAGWAAVDRIPEGRLMWDITRDYILKHKGPDNVLRLAKINHPKLQGVKNNPGIADYEGEIG